MCGIAGIWNPEHGPQRETLQAMIATLNHRGPDGVGFHLDGPVGLAHSRLAIIDIAGGAQPMSNEDGTVWVSCNGEIFNYPELRVKLIQRGHRFSSRSDTEVLVHLYEEYGKEFLQELNGQFAIALWDVKARQLLLARDPVGIRPLYYAWQGRQLAFASEVKALFAVPGQVRDWDTAGLASTFSWWSALPPATVFKGVQNLPPGHLMIIGETGHRIEQWWEWPGPDLESDYLNGDNCDEDQLADELHALIVDAVRLQTRADVPVGAYLSGGLDSAIITAAIRSQSTTPLRSFSLTFDDAEFDESAHQNELVSHLGTTHSSVSCSRADIAGGFARAVWHAETPLIRAAPAPMMHLAQSVRNAGFKVVLTGEGADEVFAGYDIFKEAKVRRFIAAQPNSSSRTRILERLYPYLKSSPMASRAMSQRFFTQSTDQIDKPWFAHTTRLATTRRSLGFFNLDRQQELGHWDPYKPLCNLLPGGIDSWPVLARDQAVEATTLMSGYLLSSQGDRMAMAASIETRYPFLDPRVIAFGARLPARLKMRGLIEKLILRKAFARDLPSSITKRTKQPYRTPDSAAFFEAGKPLDWVADILDAPSILKAGLFDAPAVSRLVAKCSAGRAIGFGDNMAFVGVLSTMLVHQQFIEPATGPASEPSAS
ncbi:asparagine synthase (glutamine-hydrolyzing) [Granulosicoccus antarcticus]|uniref:asparagine synthase (glutamine-hydrolyzing) n=1 Tax=Granulosicoccus antarcticus IMCC3135 TaxID=1192854 RepID=A0A2Z2NYF9_9GAMM|nr:asparagine synthase (glutamine-hydrolyzing) [Granulosicoccus antarcticus]ASJ74798.1 Asparagine synthetase [glutamine-hydrolyzing] 1 [Granulosicoccus antarcticus IMCC3135]